MAEFGEKKKKDHQPRVGGWVEKLPHKEDSEEVNRWQRSVREDRNIAELYNLPREGAGFFAGGWGGVAS